MSDLETGGSGGLTKPSPDEPVILHGDLELEVIEARCLPNMDLFSENLRGCFATCGVSSSTRSPNRHRRHVITSDPYVTLVVADAVVARTRVIPNSEFPVWNDRFLVPLAHSASHVRFLVKDNDAVGAQLIGTVSVPASRVASGELIKEWFPVIGSNGKVPKPDTALHVSMKFTPVEKNPLYACGIAGDPAVGGVREAYFPVRKGGGLTLYQDAHVREGELPEVKMGDGRVFVHEKCWEDICQAIVEAHHLIYLVGWSIYDKVRLVREPTRPFPRDVKDMTLGDLLKYKSQEGVRILMLVWDDKTSHDKFFLKTAGVMQTHDEETKKFFKHSSVICVLSPRYASSKLSFFKQQVVGTLYTHHQKCVLVDTQAHGNTRKITAFIGGLDLCDGRYDTPEHRMFQDLDTVYKNDIHNPIFPMETKGPRQPWHDLHCKIEGPAAYDVLTNFEQRWRKATKWREYIRLRRVSHSRDDDIIKLDRISWILSPSDTVPDDDPSLWVSNENDSDTWHVQIFRSIDSGSVKGFPKSNEEALQKNLVLGKDLLIDKSIHMAYVKAIRSAKHFVYIENQYFLGSSYGWPSYNSAGADNLIPLELAFKIASKIRAGERFAVYVVIPMWPEGIPTDASIQEILFWQYQTIRMMYEVVAKELKSCNLMDSDPQDYLNFYCLGNREEPPKDIPNSNQTPGGAAEALSQKYRRFMIYVHAKGMIVDDEYVIIGSANINQRSLDGTRDTEIAMGAYQPHNSWAKKRTNPQRQIYGYRKSLWAEHLGKLDDHFNEPHSLECVRMVNKVARENWKNYTADEYVPLTGHLIKYPYQVEADGKVGPIPGQETFPDVGGKITGAPTSLPDDLTM